MSTYVIASGKGGTGKTTVAALFALLATECGPLVVADADVEASNLPLALGAREVFAEKFDGDVVAEIDARGCRGCGLCADVCRPGAILEPDFGPDVAIPTLAYRVDPLLCEGCGACAQVPCANAAVHLVPSTVGEVVHSDGPTGPIVSGHLEPGKSLSGRLVTEVRKTAARLAEEGSAALVLVDGPPGVGCPFLASLAGADGVIAVAEPSVSGVHDLARLLDVVGPFDIPVYVLLNKADLSTEGATALRELCDVRQAPLLGEIPFDETLAALPLRLASAGGRLEPRALAERSEGVASLVTAWETLHICTTVSGLGTIL